MKNADRLSRRMPIKYEEQYFGLVSNSIEKQLHQAKHDIGYAEDTIKEGGRILDEVIPSFFEEGTNDKGKVTQPCLKEFCSIFKVDKSDLKSTIGLEPDNLIAFAKERITLKQFETERLLKNAKKFVILLHKTKDTIPELINYCNTPTASIVVESDVANLLLNSFDASIIHMQRIYEENMQKRKEVYQDMSKAKKTLKTLPPLSRKVLRNKLRDTQKEVEVNEERLRELKEDLGVISLARNYFEGIFESISIEEVSNEESNT